MIQQFYPDEWLDSAYVIDYEKLYKEGYRGLIFDIDNTLVPHDEPVDEAARVFVKRLKELGFGICLISNNDEERVRTFADPLGVAYVYKAWKPKREGYERGMEILGTDRSNTLFVGDQIFTDVWGARRAGIFSILLDPINPKEEIQIILKRIPERYIKSNYRRKHHLKKGQYDQ